MKRFEERSAAVLTAFSCVMFATPALAFRGKWILCVLALLLALLFWMLAAVNRSKG